jgi:predicted ATP-grasp superfamily ATP-dependent carboligase
MFKTDLMTSHVFITDGHWRKTLAAVRSLGKKGLRVVVGESTRLSVSLFSRYCHQGLVYPSPLQRPDDFLDWLHNTLSHRPYRLVLAMEDETQELVSRHHAQFSRLTYLPFLPYEKIEQARRKDLVLKLAQKLGIPTPRTWFIDNVTQLDQLKNQLPFPVVIKPRIGSGALGVIYINDPQKLESEYQRIHQTYPFPMIQEQIPRQGPGFGASFLFDEKSQIKASFVHQRLREYPLSGGASTLRISIKNDQIREMGQSLLKALNWFGVAMVEFKLDPRDNTPKLMEINPRFWGSLSLSIASGVDFPYLVYRLARGENFPEVDHYKLGQQCRWLLPGDLLHFVYSPDRLKLKPSFFRFFGPDLCYDILSLKDPLPTLGTILTPLTFLYDADMQLRLKKRKYITTQINRL